MICPSCGYDNIEGADRCEECVTSLFNLDEAQGGKRTLARSVMEDDLSKLDREFLAVAPDSSITEVIHQMKRVGAHSLRSNVRQPQIASQWQYPRQWFQHLVAQARRTHRLLVQTAILDGQRGAHGQRLREGQVIGAARTTRGGAL